MSRTKYCNAEVLDKTVIETGESADLIRGIIDFQSQFIAAKIKEGTLEAVRIVNFGSFRPKLKEFSKRQMIRSLPETTVRKRKGI